MGTSGQFTTQSGATIDGGPGLVLDLPRDNVHRVVDWWLGLRVQRRHVGLHEPVLLGKHFEDLVLDDVHLGVDCRRVVSVLLLHVVLFEPTLHGDHLVELVLGPSFLLLDLTS